jgi:tetratricopeptide (TPR) repeat protein
MNSSAGHFLTVLITITTMFVFEAIGGSQAADTVVPPVSGVVASATPDPGPDYLQIGNTAFDERAFAAAVAAYTQISPLEIPADEQNRLAVSYFMLDRERDAEGTYRVATSRNRNLASALNNLGVLYYNRRDFRDAENRFKDALEQDPENRNFQDNLHAAKHAQENSREARELADAWVESNPLLVQRLVGDVLRVAILIPDDVQAELEDLELRGDIFLARKMFEDASIEYERSLRIDRYNPEIINKLGLAYLQLQRLNDAERQYKDALKVNPYFLPALNNLGSLEQARNRYDRAMRYYVDALEIQPDWTVVLQNIGALFFALELYDEGLDMYIRALRLDPTLLDNTSDGGLPTLAQATRINESMTNFYMAKVFASIGDRDRTMSFLYRAVEEGFDDAAMLASEPDFGILAEDLRFVQLVASLQPL